MDVFMRVVGLITIVIVGLCIVTGSFIPALQWFVLLVIAVGVLKACLK